MYCHTLNSCQRIYIKNRTDQIDNDIVSFQIESLIWALFDAYIIKKSSELILNSIYLFNKTFIIFTISWP